MIYSSPNILIQPISFSETAISNIKTQLSKQVWCAFLESADSQHIDCKWSIYTSQPIATLQQHTDHTYFVDNIAKTTEQLSGDPLIIQQNLREQFFHNESCQNFPFYGGVISAYNYEMGELFEKLKQTGLQNLNSKNTYHCAFYDWAILHRLDTNQYFLVQHVTKNNTQDLHTSWQNRANWLNQLNNTFVNSQTDFKLNKAWQSDYNKAQYISAFNDIQEYILSGDCYQVNFAQRFHASYSGDEYSAYLKLLAANKPPFAAYIRLPDQVILSVSPERLLQLNNGYIQTKPIKGTMPRDKNPDQDRHNKLRLINSNKDQAENLMIVDLLRNDIGKVSKIGSVSVPKLFDVESFPAVHHLVSTVTGELDKQFSSEDLIRACFPGGSITGAPKIRAMEIIKELEKYQREIYCGSIAYINGNGNMDSSITIRTLVCRDQKIYCWGGGGIVADSIAENEYQECFDKLSCILPVLR